MNMDELYQLRIHQFASKGYEPYVNWFTKEEVEKFLADPKNREKIYSQPITRENSTTSHKYRTGGR